MFLRFLAEHWWPQGQTQKRDQYPQTQKGPPQEAGVGCLPAALGSSSGQKHTGTHPLTSTHVSISGNWLMMGSTASMELPGRRSDLLPTRMMGTLRGEAYGHGGWGS